MEEKKMVIVITFKKSEKWIYDEVQRHSGKGNWIKDILKEYLSRKKETP